MTFEPNLPTMMYLEVNSTLIPTPLLIAEEAVTIKLLATSMHLDLELGAQWAREEITFILWTQMPPSQSVGVLVISSLITVLRQQSTPQYCSWGGGKCAFCPPPFLL